eukprot:ctg_29.g6
MEKQRDASESLYTVAEAQVSLRWTMKRPATGQAGDTRAAAHRLSATELRERGAVDAPRCGRMNWGGAAAAVAAVGAAVEEAWRCHQVADRTDATNRSAHAPVAGTVAG